MSILGKHCKVLPDQLPENLMSPIKKATISDVAQAAGVSRSTVSKVMNGTQKLPDTTEKRIWEAVRQLGYQASPHARSLSTGRSRAIGLVILDILNPHFTSIVKGAGRVAREHGYAVLLADAEEDPAQEEELIRTLQARTDGLLLAGSRLPDDQLRALHGPSSPIVTVGRVLPEMPAVVATEAQAAHELTCSVARWGAKSPTYLAGPPFWVNERRTEGYLAAMQEMRLPPVVVPLSRLDVTGGWEVVKALMERPRFPDALICYNDIVALGVIAALREMDLSVPNDVQVVAFGPENPLLTHITHAQIPSQQLGSEGADLLIQMLNGVYPKIFCLEFPTLVRLGTTSAQ